MTDESQGIITDWEWAKREHGGDATRTANEAIRSLIVRLWALEENTQEADAQELAREAIRTIEALSARLADTVQPAAGKGGLREAIAEALSCLEDEPEYHEQGMGCGLEDRGITDRYEAMAHGWQQAMERVYGENIAGAKDRLEAALSTSVPAGVVEIKPLVWMAPYEHDTTAFADSILGQWSVWDGHYRPPGAYAGICVGKSLDAAKAAAQADYATRIRACLITPPAQEPTR